MATDLAQSTSSEMNHVLNDTLLESVSFIKGKNRFDKSNKYNARFGVVCVMSCSKLYLQI